MCQSLPMVDTGLPVWSNVLKFEIFVSYHTPRNGGARQDTCTRQNQQDPRTTPVARCRPRTGGEWYEFDFRDRDIESLIENNVSCL